MSVAYYEREADAFIRETLSVDMTAVYARFLLRLPPGGAILDAGCGSGRDARAFLDRGFRVRAFDASRRMVEFAVSLTGTEVRRMTFDEVTWQEDFDGIWCCASLLHVRKIDFRAVAEKLIKALKPGGSWYLSFKLGQGDRIREERLFVDHTEDSLRGAIQDLPGIGNIETWISGDMRPGRDEERWVNAIVTKTLLATITPHQGRKGHAGAHSNAYTGQG